MKNIAESASVHESSYIDDGVVIGQDTKIWHFCHVLTDTVIGNNCSFGQNCVVGPRVRVGSNVKVQNNISIYEGVEIEDDVFLGPSCVLTNVINPRSQVSRKSLYEKTLLQKGCSIGANATIVCGVSIGRYAFVGAGAVVHQNVPDYALMLGVPAKQKGWMSRHGHVLIDHDKNGTMVCPESNLRYQLHDGQLRCLDLDENSILPGDLQVGTKFYQDLKDR
jgi:UDP-2-acetamido-3-amino-2,3-dideoxy-glucuronate N-acetyltransferase